MDYLLLGGGLCVCLQPSHGFSSLPVTGWLVSKTKWGREKKRRKQNMYNAIGRCWKRGINSSSLSRYDLFVPKCVKGNSWTFCRMGCGMSFIFFKTPTFNFRTPSDEVVRIIQRLLVLTGKDMKWDCKPSNQDEEMHQNTGSHHSANVWGEGDAFAVFVLWAAAAFSQRVSSYDPWNVTS